MDHINLCVVFNRHNYVLHLYCIWQYISDAPIVIEINGKSTTSDTQHHRVTRSNTESDTHIL